MQIVNVLSKRFVEDWPSYQIIYEWEDVLANNLSIPIINARPLWRKFFINRYTKKLADAWGIYAFDQLSNAVEKLASKQINDKSLVFELYVSTEPSFSTSAKVIPILIDFWKHTDLQAFYQTYKRCFLVLVSSLEVLQYLRAHNCPLNIAHLPLSLSDKYHLKADIIFHKSFDILFAGRSNKILLSFMQEFVQKFPDTEFLQQHQVDGELYYISNKRGVIGKFHSRSEYMTLLRACKVSFYSTPGIDGGEERTGGFNPVTPRFLELLSAQCLLMGRYPNNEETEFYELKRVCPNIDSYEEFEAVLLGYLSQQQPSFAVHREILDKHYTSCRAKQLAEIVAQF